MYILLIIGAVVLAVLVNQVYYILLHYNDIVAFVTQYKDYRYNIDIVPSYTDPSTSDYNDVIFSDVKLKRRCVLTNGNYSIVSSNGYAIDDNSNIITYSTLLDCINDMTENYINYSLYNPCSINALSAACTIMNNLLN
jgi:hypothetical protein